MARAILISGSPDFLNNLAEINDYLKQDVGASSIKILEADRLGAKELLRFLEEDLQQHNTEESLLLVYCGHGWPGCWTFDCGEPFPYAWLAVYLRHRRGANVIVNNCCHGLSIVDAFLYEKLDPNRYCVIAACGADETTGIPIDRWILADWKRGIAYEKIKIITHGFIFDTIQEVTPQIIEKEIERHVKWHWR